MLLFVTSTHCRSRSFILEKWPKHVVILKLPSNAQNNAKFFANQLVFWLSSTNIQIQFHKVILNLTFSNLLPTYNRLHVIMTTSMLPTMCFDWISDSYGLGGFTNKMWPTLLGVLCLLIASLTSNTCKYICAKSYEVAPPKSKERRFCHAMTWYLGLLREF